MLAVVFSILLWIGVKARKKILAFVVWVVKKQSHNLAAQTGNTVSDVSLSDLSQAEPPDAKTPGPADTTDFWRSLERQLSESDLVPLNSGFSSSRHGLPNLRDRRRSGTSLGALQDVCV